MSLEAPAFPRESLRLPIRIHYLILYPSQAISGKRIVNVVAKFQNCVEFDRVKHSVEINIVIQSQCCFIV